MRRSFYLISIIVIGLMLLVTASYSQNKEDYYWPFGKDQASNIEDVQASEFNFNNKPFASAERIGGLQFDQQNASICDKDGNLIFYTNGCAVANRFHEVMPNGDSLNAGLFFDEFWFATCDRGYPGTQDIMILSDPAYDQGFYILHKPTSYNPKSTDIYNVLAIDSIEYSYVDMILDGGKGVVVEKNVNLYEGSLLASYLSAIQEKGTNNYWIINPIKPSGFIVYKLTENGLELHSIEQENLEWDPIYSSGSDHAEFSPDGRRYALFNVILYKVGYAYLISLHLALSPTSLASV